jgi:branched-chain amino acid transport system ATP-binding protein
MHSGAASPALSVKNLEVVYDDVIQVLSGVSLTVPEGKIVALLGANGGGKTTLLRAVTGLLDVHDGEITKGSVEFDGQPIDRMSPSKIAELGIKQVLEGRRIFAELTVEENLRIGGHVAPKQLRDNLERAYSRFPVLAQRGKRIAGYLSGGEQQMLAMGRALMSQPRCLLLDEPSLGLIVEINGSGMTVLLVEQNATMALSIADHGYVMENGKIVMDKPAAELLEDSDVREFYLGLGAEGATKSFRDVKHYKRRKRWLS